eukprot:snap_masked-scaffold_13-processed-gene-0.29-mRNA-1 protein AED:0.20 eAED:0.20 QI:0/0/0/1/1/1/2/0/1037
MNKVLSVAEKPSIAKTIAKILAGGHVSSRPGLSKYNHCFDFYCEVGLSPGHLEQVSMTMTSVSGHLMEADFSDEYKKWRNPQKPPRSLFCAPIKWGISGRNQSAQIASTLRREAREAEHLIIWTDCDREGEAIGFEIANICQKSKPGIQIHRAQFSAANQSEIFSAIRNLRRLNKEDKDAVLARSELDLRTGAAFTRLLTLQFQNRFVETRNVISFGPCQFPTLGFVVDRWLKKENFVPEPFWYIYLETGKSEEENIVFKWDRNRLFDEAVAFTLYEKLIETNQTKAVVKKITKKTKNRWKPLPLSTVELQMRVSKYLKINSSDCMHLAEQLYQEGYISYPRTETDSFLSSINLKEIISKTFPLYSETPHLSSYAGSLLSQGKFEQPRDGKKNDLAHPPIYPTKPLEPGANMPEKKKKIYDFICRHFLACCSKDARLSETTVNVCVKTDGVEGFHASGLVVDEANYLDIYIYEKVSNKVMPVLQEGEEMDMKILELREGKTTPPELLTEVELIKLMDKHRIGTDATLQEHIKKVEEREYVTKLKRGKNSYFHPTPLGIGLVTGFRELAETNGQTQSDATNYIFDLSTPHERGAMEDTLYLISSGEVSKDSFLVEAIRKYEAVYLKAESSLNVLSEKFAQNLTLNADATNFKDTNGVPDYLNPNLYEIVQESFSHCGKCQSNSMALAARHTDSETSYAVKCMSCDSFYPLPRGAKPTAEEFFPNCRICDFQVLSLQRPNKGAYHICPHCWSTGDNTSTAVIDIENINKIPCFKCTHECELSSKKPVINSCANCGGNMVFHRSKNGYVMLMCDKNCNAKPIFLPKFKQAYVEKSRHDGNCEICGNLKMRLIFSDRDKYISCPNPACSGTSDDFRESATRIRANSSMVFRSTGSTTSAQVENAQSVRNHHLIQNENINTRNLPRHIAQAPLFFQQTTGESYTEAEYNSCSKCNESVRVLTVKKATSNQGRKFYNCESCGNFEFLTPRDGMSQAVAPTEIRQMTNPNPNPPLQEEIGLSKRKCPKCNNYLPKYKRKCRICD